MDKSGYKQSFESKSLIWHIDTYSAEAWTLFKDLRCRMEAFKIQC